MNQLPLEVRANLAIRDFEKYEEQFVEMYMRFTLRNPGKIRFPERQMYVDENISGSIDYAELAIANIKTFLRKERDFTEDSLIMFYAKLNQLRLMLTNLEDFIDESGY